MATLDVAATIGVATTTLQPLGVTMTTAHPQKKNRYEEGARSPTRNNDCDGRGLLF